MKSQLGWVVAITLLLCQSFGTLAFAAADDHADSGHSAVAEEDHEHTDDGHGDSHAAKNTNLLSIDPDLAICTAIVFLLLMAILTKFAWGPISEALNQREKAVADNIADAERQNEEARRLLADHEAKLAGAATEMKQLIDDAKRQAEEQKQSILAEAQAAAESEKERALRAIEAAKNSALQGLAEKSVDTAVGLAGQIVRRQLSSEDHSEMIGEALKQFPSDN